MQKPHVTTARILIIDDEPANVLFLERLLQQEGYTQVVSTTDSRQAITLFADCQPNLVLLDLHMPYLDGFRILEHLKRLIPSDAYMPILVLTADITAEAKQRALSEGAADFLSKPLDAIEVLLRIRNLLQTHLLYCELQTHNQRLEEQVTERTQQLEEARIETLNRLALAAEYRDDETGEHTQRVGRMAALLAVALGLPQSQVSMIRRAAALHDIGKIGIPDSILLKPGKLTMEEFEIIKTHTTIGAELLAGSDVALLQLAEVIACSHHERWDGTGYPHGLVGEAIPLAGRIVAVADTFDVIIHTRPYKVAQSIEVALAEIERYSGQRFDPRVVRAFVTLMGSQAGAYAPAQVNDMGRRARTGAMSLNQWGGPLDRKELGALLPGSTTTDRDAGIQTQISSGQAGPGAEDELVEALTPREYDVLRLLAEGQTNREIAQELILSVGTVKIHVEHILGKLGTSSRTQAAVRAYQLDLLHPRASQTKKEAVSRRHASTQNEPTV